MRRKLSVVILTLFLSVVSAQVIAQLDTSLVTKVEAATELKLTNVGSRKTLYQYLQFQIKTNVSVSRCRFSTSKASVATVSKKGVVKAKKKGTATITVKYGSQKKQVKLTVKKAGNNYSPSRVAKIANQRIRNYRNLKGEKMVYIPDLLDKQLKNKEITRKEYKKYYPDSGTGYLILYYKVTLDEILTIDGQRLRTELAIAEDIADYYRGNNAKYYYVKYDSKKLINGTWYYVFHAHNG